MTADRYDKKVDGEAVVFNLALVCKAGQST